MVRNGFIDCGTGRNVCLNVKENSMKRTIAFVSLAAALAVAALAQSSTVKADDCKDCPIDHCPYCPHSK